MKNKSFYIKLTQWEHWPTVVYYLPLLPFFLIRSIKAKHPFHYLATNPGIFYSGIGTESKYKTLLLIPEKYRPKSLLIQKNEDYKSILKKLKKEEIVFPLIAKPDIGFRGYLVKKIDSEIQLKSYLSNIDETIILQEFIDLQNEIGIFYHRFPDQKNGKITSITVKKYLTITCDGKSTLSELILQDERAFLYYDLLKNIHKDNLNSVFKKDEKLTLSVIGNHSKGTQFLNGNHLINKELEHSFDQISHQIKGWYYGRLDIKYNDFEDLVKANDFKIIEVNGIISEPTHIYDATSKNASYFEAVRSINYHWNIMDKIALMNHKKYAVEYPKILPYVKNMLWLGSYSKKLKKLNKKDF
ncbi:MAG: hypothetical protein ABFR32_04410 [Bacteroidota bacterium]